MKIIKNKIPFPMMCVICFCFALALLGNRCDDKVNSLFQGPSEPCPQDAHIQRGAECSNRRCRSATSFNTDEFGCIQYSEGCKNCNPSLDRNSSRIIPVPEGEALIAKSKALLTVEPVYYSSMDSLADIQKEGSSSSLSGTGYSENFSNKHLHRYHSASISGTGYSSSDGYRIINPTGSNSADFSNGTISMWLNLRTVSSVNSMQSKASSTIFSTDKSKVHLYFVSENASSVMCYLYVNNALVGSKSVTYGNQWFHIYAVWGEGLANGKTMRIFIDRKEVLFTYDALPDMSSFNFMFNFYGYVMAHGDRKCKKKWGIIKKCSNITGSVDASVYADSLKLWNEIISEDPETEYYND